MSLFTARHCSICAARPTGSAFPYATRFNAECFGYLKCGQSKSVVIASVLHAQTFALMNAKSGYLDR